MKKRKQTTTRLSEYRKMPQQHDNVTTAQRLEQPQCNKKAHSAVQVAKLFRKSRRRVVQKLKPQSCKPKKAHHQSEKIFKNQ